jgi:hypothetical protein
MVALIKKNCCYDDAGQHGNWKKDQKQLGHKLEGYICYRLRYEHPRPRGRDFGV